MKIAATTEAEAVEVQGTAPVAAEQTATETAETGKVEHTSTLYAEPIGHIGSFTVTNSLLNSWVVVIGLVVFAIFVRNKISKVPRGIQNYLELVYDQALQLADSVTGSREKSMKFIPLVMPLFVFILLNNWLGMLPGVGSIGFIETEGVHKVFIPLFRGATADLNTTLALGIMAVVLTHVAGVMMTSAWAHLNRFVGINLFLELPRKVFKEKEYSALMVNPIKFFVGIIEIIGEFAKVASLSFRLFGNVFAGEVLLSAMAAICAYFLPLPFMFLEIIVGIIQALIFSMLTLVFLTIMSTSHEEHAEETVH